MVHENKESFVNSQILHSTKNLKLRSVFLSTLLKNVKFLLCCNCVFVLLPTNSYSLSLVLLHYWRRKHQAEIMSPAALRIVQLTLVLVLPINAEIGKSGGEMLY